MFQWDIQGNMASHYFRSWDTCLPGDNYFLIYLSGDLVSVKMDILTRYAGLYRSLFSRFCKEVSIMARIAAKDIRTVTAKNLKMIEKKGGLTWSSNVRKIREELSSREAGVPDADAWRLPYLGKLLEER